jgi:phosphomannomutase
MFQVLHDKDGVTAAAVFAEMRASLATRGATCVDQLAWIMARYGHHVTRAHYFVAPTPAVSKAVFERLRAEPPQVCGNYNVIAVRM